MNRESMQKLRLDRRLIRRAGWLSVDEVEGELSALPDVGHKATTLGEIEDEARSDADTGEPSA